MAKTQFHVGRNKIRKIKIKLLKYNIYPEVTYLTDSTIKNSERHVNISKKPVNVSKFMQ